MTVEVEPNLPDPVILGREWPEFSQVLQTASLQTGPEKLGLEGDLLEDDEEGQPPGDPLDPPEEGPTNPSDEP